jgi:GTPase
VEELRTLLFNNVEEGPPRFPTEDYTTQPERFFAAELVREKVLQHTSEELPYTTAVNVDRFEEGESKGIIVRKQGSMIRQIGTEARQELESILGVKVFLDLHVSAHPGWREDERFLGELEWPLE